jgi:predicted DNA-binding transcriptional regulator AlpA
MSTETETDDRLIFRKELCEKLHVGSEAIRRRLQAGRLPKPDVDVSQRTQAWRLSTLIQAGIRIV